MKEVTYKNWIKNPTPRRMRVWRDDENSYVIRKVVYILKENYVLNRVITIDDDESDFDLFNHCAEIEKQRRMTHKELSRWLKEKPTREYKRSGRTDIGVNCFYSYIEEDADQEVDENFLIREDDGEWREPLVQVEE